jgi:hypothetical protein
MWCVNTTKTLSFLTLSVLAASPLAAITFYGDYSGTALCNTVDEGSYTQYEGLSCDGTNVYFGNYREVLAYNIASESVGTYGTLPGNNGISQVTVGSGCVYASYYTSASAPYPYQLGSVTSGGSFSQIATVHGLFDAEYSSSGSLYFVANPDVTGDDEGDGSRIYRMDTATNSITEVAYVGGASGGLALDAAGNLYYAHYDNGVIYSFSAAELMIGGLTLTDADAVLNLTGCGYLDIDANGNLLASALNQTTWVSTLSLYDLTTGDKLADICSGLSSNFVENNGTIYAIEQSWSFSNYGSTLYAIVPEPSTWALMASGFCGMVVVFVRGRRKSAI